MTEQKVAVRTEEFRELKTTGIRVYYAMICETRLWLFSRGLNMEQQSDRVALGRLLHETSYRSDKRREILVDGKIVIDLVPDRDLVVEVKHSTAYGEAARLQLAYYLWYLRQLGAGNLSGELRFPRQRRREKVELTGELEEKVLETLLRIREVESLKRPPQPRRIPACRRCAYAELCWG